MGPRGPVTSLPTLDRVREGPKCQGLRRVVTDTVTTLAGEAAVRGVVRRAVSSGPITRASHAVAVAQRFTHGDDDRCGARGPASRISGCRSSRHPNGAVETAWRPLLRRDRGPPGTSRSPMTGRASSSDDAAKLRVLLLLLLVAPGLAGAFISNALIERRAWVSQPRNPEGPRTDPAGGLDSVHSDDDESVAGFGSDQTPGKRGCRGGLSGVEEPNAAGAVGRILSKGASDRARTAFPGPTTFGPQVRPLTASRGPAWMPAGLRLQRIR